MAYSGAGNRPGTSSGSSTSSRFQRPALSEDKDLVETLFDQLKLAGEALVTGVNELASKNKTSFRNASLAMQPMTKVDKLLEMQKTFDALRNEATGPLNILAESVTTVLDDISVQVKAYGKLQKLARRMANRQLFAALNTWKAVVEDKENRIVAKLREPRFQSLLHRVMGHNLQAAFVDWKGWARTERYKYRIIEERQDQKRALEKELEGLKESMEQLREQRMREVLQRILHGDKYKVFSAWRAVAADAKSNERKRLAEELKEGRLRSQKAEAEAEALRLSKMEQVLRRILQQELARAWTQFKTVTLEAIEVKKKMKRAAFRMMMRCVAMAWQQWHGVYSENKKTRGLLNGAAKKMLNRAISGAFDRWCEMAEEAREMRVKLARCATKMKNSQILGAWTRWCEMTEEAHEMRVKLERCAMKMKNREILGAWSRWCEMTEEAQDMRLKLSRCAAKMKNSQLIGAWERWCEMCDEAKDMRAKLERAAARMLNRCVASAFETWVEMCGEVSETREKLKRAAMKMMMRCVSDALERWMEFAEEAKEMRVKIERSLGRLRNREIAGAFDRWTSFVEETVNMRVLLTRCAVKMKHGQLVTAFNHWLDVIQFEIAEREREEREERERKLAKRQEEQTQEKLKRIILRVKNRCVSNAFDRWAEMSEEMREMRTKIERSLGRLKNREIAQAFDRWSEHVSEAQEMRQKLRIAAGKMLMRAAASAFATWKEAWQTKKENGVKMKRFLKRMLNSQLIGSFESWSEYAEEQKKQRIMVKRTLMKMLRRELAQAFDRWLQYLDDLAQQRKEEQENRIKMERFARKLRNREIIGAFTRWAEMTEEAVAMRVKLTRFMKRLQNSGLIAAFATWFDWVQEMLEMKRKIRKVLMKTMNAAMANAWAKWIQMVEDARANLSEEERREGVLRRAMARMLNARVAAAFGAWQDVWAQKQRVKGMIRRLMNRGLAMAFQTWYDVWQETVRERMAEDEEEARKERVVMQVLQKLKNREMAAAWSAWFEQVEQKRRLRGLANRMRMGAASKAFAMWISVVEERGDQRRLLHKVAARMLMRRVSMAFNSWLDAIESIRRTRNLMSRMRNPMVGHCFNLWLDAVDEAREANADALSKAEREDLEERRRKAEAERLRLEREHSLKSKAAVHFRQSESLMVFMIWKENWESIKAERMRIQAAYMRMTRSAMGKAFQRWREMLDETQEQRDIAQRALQRMRNLAMSRAFVNWRQNARALKKNREARIAESQVAQAHQRVLLPMLELIEKGCTDLAAAGKTVKNRSHYSETQKETWSLISSLRHLVDLAEKRSVQRDPKLASVKVRQQIRQSPYQASEVVLDHLERMQREVVSLRQRCISLAARETLAAKSLQEERTRLANEMRHQLAQALQNGARKMEARLQQGVYAASHLPIDMYFGDSMEDIANSLLSENSPPSNFAVGGDMESRPTTTMSYASSSMPPMSKALSSTSMRPNSTSRPSTSAISRRSSVESMPDGHRPSTSSIVGFTSTSTESGVEASIPSSIPMPPSTAPAGARRPRYGVSLRKSMPNMPVDDSVENSYMIVKSQSGRISDGGAVAEAAVRRSTPASLFSGSSAQRSTWWSQANRSEGEDDDDDDTENAPQREAWERPVDPMVDINVPRRTRGAMHSNGPVGLRARTAAVSPRMPLHAHDPAYYTRPPAAGLLPEDLGITGGPPPVNLPKTQSEVTVRAHDKLIATPPPQERGGVKEVGKHMRMSFGSDAVNQGLMQHTIPGSSQQQ